MAFVRFARVAIAYHKRERRALSWSHDTTVNRTTALTVALVGQSACGGAASVARLSVGVFLIGHPVTLSSFRAATRVPQHLCDSVLVLWSYHVIVKVKFVVPWGLYHWVNPEPGSQVKDIVIRTMALQQRFESK